MSQTLVINKKFYDSMEQKKNLEILKKQGYPNVKSFLGSIVARLNDEFSFLEITDYRFQTDEEKKLYSQYGAFVYGDTPPYKKVIVFFTPIDSKMGNVIIEQSLMPTICKQMEDDINFLLDSGFKKIILLTSRINKDNKVSAKYQKMQMDVNSLNTLGFDVIPFFQIKNLSTDTKFNSLPEYLEMSNYIQKRASSNSQIEYLTLKDNVLFGYCKKSQWEGEFPKSFCFRFLSAILSGGNDYKYDIEKITSLFPEKDNQLENLQKFINHIDKTLIKSLMPVTPIDDTIIECDDDIESIADIHRKPEKAIDTTGRKRYKTQKKIRDSVLKAANYLCDCNDSKHFYFDSVESHNYVEGHHIVPMNRQEEYYFDRSINLDIPSNIVPLCPTCHCQIHLGNRQARLTIISELFVRNKEKLLSFNPDLTLPILASYYNIGLDEEEADGLLKAATKVIAEKADS